MASAKHQRFNSTLYQRDRVRWTQTVWYGRQRDLFAEKRARVRGREYELLAAGQIFPRLEITGAVDLCALVSSAPFDFIANLNLERIVIDVSTKWQKRVDAKSPLAAALGFSFYLLLVSPRDPALFYFVKVRPEAKSVRVPFALLQAMAQQAGEERHGRK